MIARSCIGIAPYKPLCGKRLHRVCRGTNPSATNAICRRRLAGERGGSALKVSTDTKQSRASALLHRVLRHADPLRQTPTSGLRRTSPLRQTRTSGLRRTNPSLANACTGFAAVHIFLRQTPALGLPPYTSFCDKRLHWVCRRTHPSATNACTGLAAVQTLPRQTRSVGAGLLANAVVQR